MDIIKDLRTQRILLLSFLLGLTCSVLTLFFNDHIGNDTAVYYTRIAHEFIEGNFERAYFHLIPPLVPSLAGLVGKLGFSAWMAMKLVSCIFFLAGIYWAYRLACLKLPPEKAQWCSLLFVACPRLLRYGMAGQLDAAKIFLLIFIFERAINYIQSKRWTLLFQASIGSALLALCRNEGIGYFALIGIFLLLGEWIFPDKANSGRKKLIKGLGRNVFALSVCLVIWSPWMIYEYRITGYPVLGSKQIPVLQKLFPFLDKEQAPPKKKGEAYNEQNKDPKRLRLSPELITQGTQKDKNKNRYSLLKKIFEKPKPFSVHSKFVETIKGIYLPYFILAILGVWILFASKRWTPIDSLFAAVFLLNIPLQWFVVPDVLKRLIAPTIPFYLPWVIFGFEVVKHYFEEKTTLSNYKKGRLVGYSVLGVVVAIMLWDGMSSTRKSLRGKDETVKQIGLWIKNNREQFNFNKTESLKSSKHAFRYFNGRQPVIATNIPQIVTWANADLLLIYPGWDWKRILSSIRKSNADLLIVDNTFKKTFPDINLNSHQFKLISDKWEDQGILVYSHAQNLNGQ
jgi:hypothetical protein